MNSPEKILEIKNVSKNFGSVEALRNINLSVNRAELFGLIGPDGAGKSSLFRLITTLLVPDTGTISLLNYDTIQHYKEIRQRIGYMPGRFSLYPDLTVQENLEFWATVFGTSIEENYDLIREIYCQLEPFKNRQSRNLSGGMKQKLALSCALIHNPEFLVLDEPTTGVDAVSRKEFWEMLQKLRSNGMSLMVSTPYMDEAVLCDRVALIQHGEIMTIDTPANVTLNFPKQLIKISNGPIYKMMKEIRQYSNTGSVHIFGQEIHYTETSQEVDTELLKHYLIDKGFANVVIENIHPTIEDCFMYFMQNDNTRGNNR